jgi:hypothetical protein
MFELLLRINTLYGLAVEMDAEMSKKFLALVLEMNFNTCCIAREM